MAYLINKCVSSLIKNNMKSSEDFTTGFFFFPESIPSVSLIAERA